MTTQVAQPMKLAPAAAAATPDPSTLSARERIRLHVQRNIQQQQQQAAAAQKQAQSAPVQVAAHRKRSLAEATGGVRQVREAAVDWEETNTPPSAPVGSPDLSMGHPSKRRELACEEAYTEGMDEARFREDDEEADQEDLACPSPPLGMMPARIDGALDTSLEGPEIYANPEEARSRTASPGKDMPFDSPPFEQQEDENWSASSDVAEATSSSAEVVEVADDWVKGLYAMEGMK
mmetsp:Transcript_5892/g.14950  ORF Transcript_5892/g.14950 Transcript_5892/m.14950 type:complete len:234 (-) Transcript_5892:1008-1709(-)